MTPSQRLAFLHRETLAEWFLRFCRERGLPEPSEAEIAELIRLGKIDERDGHQ